MTMRLVLESKREGDHFHVRVRMGEAPGHAGFCGGLIMRVGEWQLFGAALLAGADHCMGHLRVEIVGDGKPKAAAKEAP